jgi:hypothetical protein
MVTPCLDAAQPTVLSTPLLRVFLIIQAFGFSGVFESSKENDVNLGMDLVYFGVAHGHEKQLLTSQQAAFAEGVHAQRDDRKRHKGRLEGHIRRGRR